MVIEMDAKNLFAESLQKLLNLAKDQGNCVSREQTEEIMKPCRLDENQLQMVYDYLTAHKVGIDEPVNLDDYLSDEEINYLELYQEELKALPEYSEGEREGVTLSAMAGDKSAQARLIEMYLPQVIDIAKLYSGQGVFLEDLIGEGNVALTAGVTMLGALENASEAQGMLGKLMMDAMEELIREDAEEQKKDSKIADKVNKVADAANELAQTLGRKVTPAELADETGMSLYQILEAIRVSADKIEQIDPKADQI